MNHTILLAEHDTEARQHLAEMFSRAGHQVSAFGSEAEAYPALAEQAFDVALIHAHLNQDIPQAALGKLLARETRTAQPDCHIIGYGVGPKEEAHAFWWSFLMPPRPDERFTYLTCQAWGLTPADVMLALKFPSIAA